MLKHLKRVFIEFHPGDPQSTAARELLQRVGNAQARKSNPDCVVDYKVVETAHIPKSVVELQFSDNESHKLYTADLKVADIVKIIEQKATEMELRSVMKDLALLSIHQETAWQLCARQQLLKQGAIAQQHGHLEPNTEEGQTERSYLLPGQTVQQ
eukprot:gene227-430_t